MANNNQFQGKPPRGARVPMRFDKKTIKRLMSYMKPYTPHMIGVLVCVIITAVASVSSSMFLGTLIDDHIMPMVENNTGDFSGLLRTLIMMGCLFSRER